MDSTETITGKNQSVVITTQGRRVSARLYVNTANGMNNATATPMNWTGKTVAGARRWAGAMLGPSTPLRELAS